jgi:hypothetical protein
MWQERSRVTEGDDDYYVGRCKNLNDYDVIVEVNFTEHYTNLTPENKKFRLKNGESKDLVAKLKVKGVPAFSWSTLYTVTVVKAPAVVVPPTPVTPTVEVLTGNGTTYRGAQTKTKSGLECQKWSNQAPHRHRATAAKYPNSGLFDSGFENACRNPDGDATIWCYTMSPTKLWEACEPLTN